MLQTAHNLDKELGLYYRFVNVTDHNRRTQYTFAHFALWLGKTYANSLRTALLSLTVSDLSINLIAELNIRMLTSIKRLCLIIYAFMSTTSLGKRIHVSELYGSISKQRFKKVYYHQHRLLCVAQKKLRIFSVSYY